MGGIEWNNVHTVSQKSKGRHTQTAWLSLKSTSFLLKKKDRLKIKNIIMD
jgi:hypothetical protein